MTDPFTKYGVDTTPAETPSGARCPVCHTKLQLTSPPRCRLCGTEPFEVEPSPQPSPEGATK